jgi:hypothetical protein
MRHAARRLRAWLIFDVRRDDRLYSTACGEAGYISAGLHAVICDVRVLHLHSRRGDLFTGGGLREVSRWKHSPRCESSECDRDMANPSVSSAKSSEVRGERTRESQTFPDLSRTRCVA